MTIPEGSTIYIPSSRLVSMTSVRDDRDVHDGVQSTYDAFTKSGQLYEMMRLQAVEGGNQDLASEYAQKLSNLDKQFKQLMYMSLAASQVNQSSKTTYDNISQGQGSNIQEVTADNYTSHTVPLPHLEFERQYQNDYIKLTQEPQSQLFLSDKGKNALEMYRRFRTGIHNMDKNAKSMPDIERLFDDYVGDDDLEVEDERISYKCPLSNALFEDPVTNVCGHTYSKRAVQDYIRRKQRVQEPLDCPVTGCSRQIAPNHLHPSPGIAQQVEKYRKQLDQERTQANATLTQL